MRSKIKKLVGNQFFIAGIFFLITLLVTAQSLLMNPKTYEAGGTEYTHYNNYVIFSHSFFHLIENKDLYQLYPDEHWDYYKYSPSFPLLMAPMAIMPAALGLLTWNLLNVLLLVFALWKLPALSNNKKLLMLGVIVIELITSIQNTQSNGIIAGLIIFAFIFLERKQTAIASLFIVLTIFIKLFGLVALSLFIFYPNKLKAIIYTIGWLLLIALMPVLVVPYSQLVFLYQSWLNLLQNDHSTYLGLSVAGWLNSWFNIESKNLIIIIGAILFCLPLLKSKYFEDIKFKLFFLSSILIWIVIFNHKAESPTFVIAISGVAIWFASQKIKTGNAMLLIAVFIFTILSPTDIFPKNIRNNYITPYVLKAVPCILVWLKITFDLFFYRAENKQLVNN